MTEEFSTGKAERTQTTSRRRALKGLGTGVVFATTGLAGCTGTGDGGDGDGDGGDGDGGGTTDTDVGATTSLPSVTITFMRPGNTDPDKGMPMWVEPAIEEFESEHSNVTVEPLYVGHSQKYTKFSTLASAGDQPHVFSIPGFNLPQIQQQTGVKVDLNEYLPQEMIDQYLYTEKVTEQFGGPLYGLPHFGGTWSGAWYWWQSLYEQAGLSGPPETMADVPSTLEAIISNTDAAGLGIALSGNVGMSSIIAYWGAFVFGMTGQGVTEGINGNAVFNNDMGIEGTKLWKSMKPFAQEQPTSFSRFTLRAPFGDQKIAHHIDGPWPLEEWEKEFGIIKPGETDLQHTVMPRAHKGSQSVGGMFGADSHTITRDDNVEWSAKFIEHLGSRKWQNLHSVNFKSIPMRKDIAEEEEWAQRTMPKIQVQAAQQAQTAPFHVKAGQIVSLMTKGLQEIWFDETTVKEGLASMESQINEL